MLVDNSVHELEVFGCQFLISITVLKDYKFTLTMNSAMHRLDLSIWHKLSFIVFCKCNNIALTSKSKLLFMRVVLYSKEFPSKDKITICEMSLREINIYILKKASCKSPFSKNIVGVFKICSTIVLESFLTWDRIYLDLHINQTQLMSWF